MSVFSFSNKYTSIASAFIRSSAEPFTDLGFTISGAVAGGKEMENVELV